MWNQFGEGRMGDGTLGGCQQAGLAGWRVVIWKFHPSYGLERKRKKRATYQRLRGRVGGLELW